MISYSERIFTGHEIALWMDATNLVESLKGDPGIRCHELARAVGRAIGLEWQDGSYGFVDHTWLWTKPLGRTVARTGFPNILDVYAVGRMPMVTLVDCQHTCLPHVGWGYRPGEARSDINDGVVTLLTTWFVLLKATLETKPKPMAAPAPRRMPAFDKRMESLLALAVNNPEREEARTAAVQACLRMDAILKERKLRKRKE